ncbi:MAG: ribonuclease III [Planctomycetes bacterium]|nr:ribonuclease III [Planctomycetota bacterium]
MRAMEQARLEQVEELLGCKFSDYGILIEAFTHSSQADTRGESNERLEFLGDSILGLIICEVLFERFPDYQEGDLTKIKSMLVSRKTCAKVANELGLPDFIKAGKSMDGTRAMSGSVAAGVLESVIAAIYLDCGFEAVREFVLGRFKTLIDKADAEQHHENFKSVLQQYCQKQFSRTPVYILLDEKGPDHDKCFEIGVEIEQRHFPSAWGVTKKDAEQKAALNALEELGVIEAPEEDSN